MDQTKKDTGLFNKEQMNKDAIELIRLFAEMEEWFVRYGDKRRQSEINKTVELLTNRPDQTGDVCKEILGRDELTDSVNNWVLRPHDGIPANELQSVNERLQELLWLIYSVCWKYRAW